MYVPSRRCIVCAVLLQYVFLVRGEEGRGVGVMMGGCVGGEERRGT